MASIPIILWGYMQHTRGRDPRNLPALPRAL